MGLLKSAVFNLGFSTSTIILQPGKPVTFQVNTGTAKGELKAYVDTPDGQEQEVFMQEMDRDLHAVRFLPKENGVYYIAVKVSSF